VCLLMSDLRGFTSLSERLTPEQVVTLLNRYLEAMIEVIMRYQGTIDEFIGDGILVIFGAPLRREDDTQRAVACAVAMQLAMASVNEQNRREGLPEVEMGIGLNTGEVVVGNIGSYRRTKYGVVGSHINLTARIESCTLGGQILISEAVLKDVGSILKIGEPMEVEAKGFEKPVILYDLRGIGGPYNLYLPEREEILSPLQEEVPVRYRVLEGTHFGGTLFQGSLVKVSPKGGEVRAEHPPAPLTTVRMQYVHPGGEEIPGDLYGKVVGRSAGEGGHFSIRFTSIPPKVNAFLQSLLAACSEPRIS